MGLNLEIINPITYPEWDNLITSTKNYSFFHTTAWARVLSESYGYTPLYFTQIENDHLRVAIPMMEVKSLLTGKRGVSLPFTDYCEPIVTGDINQEDAFQQLVEYGKLAGWKYIEAKGWPEHLHKNNSSDYCLEHTLELDEEPEKVLNKFRDSTKRNIKKALKADVEILKSNSFSSIIDYYNLHCRTRKEHGLPPQPFKFFKKIFKYVILANKGIVTLAKYNREIIAGAIYFHFEKKAIYKYGASKKEFQRLRANNLIMWKAIESYCRQGFDLFSFGKTEPTNDGLIQFKRGWGVKEHKIVNFKYSINKNNFIKSKSLVRGKHNKVISKLPIFALRLIGTLLYKHFP